jgi:putative nucleotidyltransferase with HDIG domain
MAIPLRALIIEDSEDDMELLLRELRRGGYDPKTLRVETLEAMHNALDSNTWDIIFSDYSLPKFSGLAALELYRERALNIPFIILSGTIGEGTAVAAMKAGASDYIMKGNLARLIPAIQRELREAEVRQDRRWAEIVQSALYVISKAANANIDLNNFYRMIHAVLDELMEAKNFYIALYDPDQKIIVFPYFHDYVTHSSPQQATRLLTEYVFRTGKSQLITPQVFDQLVLRGDLSYSGSFSTEWMGAVLKNGEQSIGVIAIHSAEDGVHYSERELAILDFVADQAELLILRKQTEEQIKNANLELSLAYDSTLEGWSRALELRERETAGHSQRVVNLTLELAKKLELSDQELVHIRRGALLHDIGKMGIPDSILLKPDRLTQEEWTIMRQHPIYAYQLLSPISYLLPALDIPYCHHEKWDGSGYPRGLKGHEIPLAARIFAVVDVWDALVSDRPYSPAWTKEAARNHIQEQAGKHFDPIVVSAFLTLTADIL